MGGQLRELGLAPSYRKGREDIALDFYLPVMNVAVSYDRAVGFFRSSILIIAWTALRGFVERGGKIRILCSQILAAEDIAALRDGYDARVDRVLAARLQSEVEDLLTDDTLSKPARVLAALVADGVVDLKVAVLSAVENAASRRIFHDKVGIVRDESGSAVVFKGSMNETWSGLSSDGNLESIDVFTSWDDSREAKRVADESEYFEDLWNDRFPDLVVREFPAVPRATLEAAADPAWKRTISALAESGERDDDLPGQPRDRRTLLPHQSAGLASWRASNRRGILAFATGAGKTFTALNAIRESIVKFNEVPVVIVPDRLLFGQWYAELLPLAVELEARILRAGAGHSNWRAVLNGWTAGGGDRRLVLATLQTARSREFRTRIAGRDGLFLIADEVHRLGAISSRVLLDDKLFGPRLGLSATPERAGDPEGTDALVQFFGSVLEPRYSLLDAVRDRVLTPYFYYPRALPLTASEAAAWLGVSKRIAVLRSQADEDSNIAKRLELLYFERARIVKHAANKMSFAVDTLAREYKTGQRWIVYCDDLEQLEAVRENLTRSGLKAMPYHSAMEGDRRDTLRWLDRFGGVVVAIRCLDEGVDIPSVSHALILASSKNPREFVQRRGRVLRRSKGKALAHIFDAIVVPPHSGSVIADPDPITGGELARAIQFANGAENPMAGADLVSIALDAGIEWETFGAAGMEDRDDERSG